MDVVSIGETMVLFAPAKDGQLRYANDFSSRVAGAESNTMIGLAKLGYKTGWISRVGQDELGEKIINNVRGEGVDTSGVRRDETAPTGLFFKEHTNESTSNIFYYRKHSAASRMRVSDVDDDYLYQAKYLYLTGITPLLSKTCEDMIMRAVDKAKQKEMKIIFDPNIRKKLVKEDSLAVLKRLIAASDVVLPGALEGQYLFGTQDPKEIALCCLEAGAELAVVKAGRNGAFYQNASEANWIEGYSVSQAADPVGAGDGFAAGVVSGLLDNVSLESTVKRGCAIGAMAVMVNGDVEGLPSKTRLADFMNSSVDEDVIR